MRVIQDSFDKIMTKSQERKNRPPHKRRGSIFGGATGDTLGQSPAGHSLQIAGTLFGSLTHCRTQPATAVANDFKPIMCHHKNIPPHKRRGSIFGGATGIRTLDPLIKSQLL